MKRILSGLTALLLGATAVSAVTPDNLDRYQAGSQYYAYPVNDSNAPVLTPAPDGYEPFHIEHYGRHGSRWLHADDLYRQPIALLRQAAGRGKLTPRGQELLTKLEGIAVAARNRTGELTPLGHRQHRGIARRMVKNFPAIFSKGNYVNTNSTIVIRCILSMGSEVAELCELVPGLDIRSDASMTTQDILNHVDAHAQQLMANAKNEVAAEYAARPRDISSFTSIVFNDPAWAKDSIDSRAVFKSVFEVATNSQSHDNLYDLYDYFSPRELYDEWLEHNADWYVTAGNTPRTGGRVPYAQRYLLTQIIEGADSAVVSSNAGANLRFGHESVLLPLSVLMEINGADYSTGDMDTLADNWRNYEYFPMASNLQLVFYRPVGSKQGDVLVKVLLNEKEAKLPVATTTYPYYKWKDVRDYYNTKLTSFANKFPQ